MSGKKKKGKKLPLLIVLLAIAQYFSAHISGWLLVEGEWSITEMDGLIEYIKTNPFDLSSFNLLVYLLIYGLCLCIYFRIIFQRQPPRAEMKGMEHGSNDFMDWNEKNDFCKTRITPDFIYPDNGICDCRIEAKVRRPGRS